MLATTVDHREFAWQGPVLVVPGLYGSDTRHWQTLWERRFPDFERVEQEDWSLPCIDRWSRRICETASGVDGPVLVIAHSFGCLAAVRAARLQPALIAGALLVAPADPGRFGLENRLRPDRLPFPSTLIASSNDAILPLRRAQQLADSWGSRYVNVGARGHINSQSGLGDWREGLGHFDELCRHVVAARQSPSRQPFGGAAARLPYRFAM